MKDFVEYLRSVKEQATADITNPTPLRLCMGNTSGDMDSIVGAMGMAYYLTLKTGDLWTPVINKKKDDLHLAAEIYNHLINSCKLNMEDMLFWDELIATKRPIKEVAIIDHNLIDNDQATQLGDHTHTQVKYVYDHHFDNKRYNECVDYQTRFIGSACSILVLEMKKDAHLFDEALLKDGYAHFIAAPICLDTVNFQADLKDTKWQQED